MKKKKIIQFIIISVIAIVMYINFVTIFYSIDTYKILNLGYDGYAINYSLYDGRIFMAGICFIANLFNLPISIFYGLSIIVALLISSFCVLKIYYIIQQIKPINNKLIEVLMLAVSYTYIFNFMYLDNMQFAECGVMAISILLYIISSEKLIVKQQKGQALLFAVIATFFYQGTINVWISFSCLLAILKYKKINKQLIKDIFMAAIITIISTICNFIFIEIIHKFIESAQTQRLNLNIIENTIDNLSKLPKLLINSLNLFPIGLFLIFIVGQIIIMYIYAIKYKEILKFYKLLSIICIYIISSLLLTMIYPNAIHDGGGRIFSSVGAIFSAGIIFMYSETEIFENTKFIKTAGILLIVVYFVINFVNSIYLTSLSKKCNDIDKEYSKELVSKIERIELENNIIIQQMAYKYVRTSKDNEALTTTPYTSSMKEIGMYTPEVLKLYTGRVIKKVFFEEEIFNKYFSKNQEEILLIGDTLYFIIGY